MNSSFRSFHFEHEITWMVKHLTFFVCWGAHILLLRNFSFPILLQPSQPSYFVVNKLGSSVKSLFKKQIVGIAIGISQGCFLSLIGEGTIRPTLKPFRLQLWQVPDGALFVRRVPLTCQFNPVQARCTTVKLKMIYIYMYTILRCIYTRMCIHIAFLHISVHIYVFLYAHNFRVCILNLGPRKEAVRNGNLTTFHRTGGLAGPQKFPHGRVFLHKPFI